MDDLLREYHIEKELFKRDARERMKPFISYTMDDYVFNWHHDYLIKKIEAFQRGEIPRLMVFMPPRHGKSQIVSRHAPAWIFGQNPDARVIACSYSADLASQMNRDVQRIMLSEEYHELFPESSLNAKNVVAGHAARRNSTMFDIMNHKGYYVSAGVGGAITGKGADFAIIDDPIKNQEESESKTYRKKLFNWYTSTLYTRLEKDAGVLITLTRWHEDDLAGRLLQQMEDEGIEDADQFEVVSFPAIKEDNTNPDDPREIGEALWPDKYDEQRMATIKSTLGTRYWDALYRQQPVTEGGNIIKEEWFQRYNKSWIEPGTINFYLDSAFTSKTENDPSAIMAYFEHNNDLYIWHVKTVRMGFSALVSFLVNYVKSYGARAGYLKVEPKASGQDIVDYLRNNTDITVIEDDPPKDDKVTRAHGASPYIEGGRVYAPEEDSWVGDFMAEIKAFPSGKHDDQVDVLTGAVKDVLKGDEDNIWMVGYTHER